jgi:hypothetical protein
MQAQLGQPRRHRQRPARTRASLLERIKDKHGRNGQQSEETQDIQILFTDARGFP